MSEISQISLSLAHSLKRSLAQFFSLPKARSQSSGAKWRCYEAGLGFPGVPGNGPRVSLSEDLFFPAKAGREGTAGGDVINWLHDKTVLVPIRRPSPDPPWLLLKIWGHATRGHTHTNALPFFLPFFLPCASNTLFSEGKNSSLSYAYEIFLSL